MASAEVQRFRRDDGEWWQWLGVRRAHQKGLKSQQMAGSTGGVKQARVQGLSGAIMEGGRRRVRGASEWPWAAMGTSEALARGV